jgi:hypothetical protein
MLDSQPPATPGNTHFLPYKEEVAGSNPASPTQELPANANVLQKGREHREALPGPFTATVLQPERSPTYDAVPNAASIASAAESCMSGRT